MNASFNTPSLFSRTLTRLLKPAVNEGNMSQFFTDSSTVQDEYDRWSSEQFFRDSWHNYATAAKLGDKDKKIFAATLLSIMGNECLHVCRNLPMTTEERQDADVSLTKLSEYFIPKRNKSINAMCSTLVPRELTKAWQRLANSPAHVTSMRLRTKCSPILSSLASQTLDIANAFFENLR